MDGATLGRREQPLTGPWGRATLLLHLSLFALPAVTAWLSTLNWTVYLPLVALPATFLAGLVMLGFCNSRRAGAHVIAATLLAAAIDVVLALPLIAVYSAQNPRWDLS